MEKEVKVFYGDYKNKYASCETVKDSYNKEEKTIVIKVPYFLIKVNGVDTSRQRLIVKLAKELNNKFSYWDEEACVQYGVSNTKKNDELCVSVHIIDKVIEKLGDRVEKITPITTNDIEIR